MTVRPPNILLIMADQMSALSMSLYDPRSAARTPHLDELAASGFWFEHAYCNYPLCAPARFALMAGRLPSTIGAYDNAAEFPASVPTIAHYLRARDYYTCLSGKGRLEYLKESIPARLLPQFWAGSSLQAA